VESWAESRSLPARQSSVRDARGFIRDRLRLHGVHPDVQHDAALVVSELATNAILHTDSDEITCVVRITERLVYVAVADQGHGPVEPHVRAPDDAESGRGLLLVSELAEAWGVTDNHGLGRLVWAVLREDA
jgi:anti-sigma regulatory factor (Ser/Thr protein kinase)